jgi:hypothetical protein
MDKKAFNHLINEKSPYLRQHAHNPVDWYPWSEEAFGEARNLDKPIFLSIGYSTCHWCHVMERESFTDDEVAHLLNRFFIPIKVDREERPDVDAHYMAVCQLLTGGGGWPLTLFLTPNKKAFFAGTYFPKESRFGLPGLKDLLTRAGEAWRSRRLDLLSSAEKIGAAVGQSAVSAPKSPLSPDIMDRAFAQLASQFDKEFGGFGPAPKFPTPHHLTFLLRYSRRKQDASALDLVEKTLQSMRLGGIFDHLGFGFHRYSTDARWLVPHFEKMLYDQALLAIAFTEAYQTTAKKQYRETVEDIITYVLRDLTSTEGGFYSAEDADSEGEEGRFYLWTDAEIRDSLTPAQAAWARRVFNVRPEGNFEEPGGRRSGKNILFLDRPPAELAKDLRMSERDFRKRFAAIREKLYRARARRPQPLKDTKILTDWNGLMIAALAKAGSALDREDYGAAALKAAEFIQNNMLIQGRFHHRSADGEVTIPAFLDDYAFLIWGLIGLYETGFDVRWITWAIELTDELLQHFWDKKEGGFFFTADDERTDLPWRRKEVYDSAVPSGNSVMLENLLRLGRLLGRSELEEKAAQLAAAFSGRISPSPAAYTQFLGGLDFAFGPAIEVVIAARRGAVDTHAMLKALRRDFLPNMVVLFHPAGKGSQEIAKLAPHAEAMTIIDESATAYVCSRFRCDLPTTDPEKMLARLKMP